MPVMLFSQSNLILSDYEFIPISLIYLIPLHSCAQIAHNMPNIPYHNNNITISHIVIKLLSCVMDSSFQKIENFEK